MNIADAKIVVLGGGTGANVILSALREHTEHLTAVICMSDNGGSTGILRQQYGVLPPGDVRKSLSSMSQIDSTAAEVFEYRFNSGDLSGHTVGNIFLAAYELATGSMTAGVQAMSKLLGVKGTVLPVTDEQVDIHYRRPDGSIIEGEIDISYSDFDGDKHPDIFLVPQVSITQNVKEAIAAADLVIIAPGLLYGSLAPVLMTNGLSEAISSSSAKLTCVSNIMIQRGTDPEQTISGYISEIERFLEDTVHIDHVFANNNYSVVQSQKNIPIRVTDADHSKNFTITVGDFREKSTIDVKDTTNVPRESIRHNQGAIAEAIINYISTLDE